VKEGSWSKNGGKSIILPRDANSSHYWGSSTIYVQKTARRQRVCRSFRHYGKNRKDNASKGVQKKSEAVLMALLGAR